jgi:hypothetical protein
MSRPIPNDVLASRARDKANAAKPDSRERTLWNTVARALDATTSVQAARSFLRSLSIPRLGDDAARALSRLVAGTTEPAENDKQVKGMA